MPGGKREPQQDRCGAALALSILAPGPSCRDRWGWGWGGKEVFSIFCCEHLEIEGPGML